MHWAVILITVGVGAAIVWLVTRKERAQRLRIVSLEDELKDLWSQSAASRQHHSGGGDAVKASLAFVNETLKLADVAMAQFRYTQASLYMGLARLALVWGNFVGSHPDADPDRNSLTNRLVFGLTLLRKRKLDAAHDELSRVWLQDDACAMAKMVALQAHIWVLEAQGNFEDAGEEQELLAQMHREMKGEDQ